LRVHEEVLRTANRLAGTDSTFELNQVVRELGHLNESTVRTHVVSRCCINAPKNHPHKWPYFRRVGRGKYQIMPRYRARSSDLPAENNPQSKGGGSRVSSGPLRSSVHAVIQRDGDFYVVECLELPVVTQGRTLDEAVGNIHEALSLHLEDEDLAALGLVAEPRIEIIYDMALACPA
jgi:predicted RNase H-like HicB family nuclease